MKFNTSSSFHFQLCTIINIIQNVKIFVYIKFSCIKIMKVTSFIFQYRIKAISQQQKLFGGIWEAPSSYSFVSTNNSQTDVNLLKKFGNWAYSGDGRGSSFRRRMPWLCNCDDVFLTTDNGINNDSWWGCLVQEQSRHYGLAPIITVYNPAESVSYWLRESRTGE